MVTTTVDALLRYCKIDAEDTELVKLATEIAGAKEAYLLRHNFAMEGEDSELAGLAVKAWTLHELDHPGQPCPGGIREMLNNLKFSK